LNAFIPRFAGDEGFFAFRPRPRPRPRNFSNEDEDEDEDEEEFISALVFPMEKPSRDSFPGHS